MTAKLSLFFRVEELQAEYKEEEITRKGYVKRLLSLLDGHLMETDHSGIAVLDKELKDQDITEVIFTFTNTVK